MYKNILIVITFSLAFAVFHCHQPYGDVWWEVLEKADKEPALRLFASSPLSSFLEYNIWVILRQWGVPAKISLRLVSILAGVFLVSLLLWHDRRVLWVVAASGVMQVFCGYTEICCLPILFATWWVIETQRGSPVWRQALAFTLACFAHGSCLAYLLAYLYQTWRRGFLWLGFWSIVFLGTLEYLAWISAGLHVWQLPGDHTGGGNNIMWCHLTWGPGVQMTVFSQAHLQQLLMQFVPLGILLWVFAIRGIPQAWKEQRFLVLMFTGYLLHSLTWESGVGMWDWDLYTPIAVPLFFLATPVLVKVGAWGRWAIVVQAVGTWVWIITNSVRW